MKDDSRPQTAKNSKKPSGQKFSERRGSKQPTGNRIGVKYGFNNVRKSHQLIDLSHLSDSLGISQLDYTQPSINKSQVLQVQSQNKKNS